MLSYSSGRMEQSPSLLMVLLEGEAWVTCPLFSPVHAPITTQALVVQTCWPAWCAPFLRRVGTARPLSSPAPCAPLDLAVCLLEQDEDEQATRLAAGGAWRSAKWRITKVKRTDNELSSAGEKQSKFRANMLISSCAWNLGTLCLWRMEC